LPHHVLLSELHHAILDFRNSSASIKPDFSLRQSICVTSPVITAWS